MKKVLILILFLAVAVEAQKADADKQQNNLTEVSFCQLLKNADYYKNKEIYIKATFIYAFELSELYCLGCADGEMVWVEFDESYKEHSNSSAVKKLKSKNYQGKIVNIEAIGTFYSGEGYGHLGIYPHKFVIKYLKKAEVISNNFQDPKSLVEKKRKKICQ